MILIADQAGTEYLQAVRDLCTAKGVILIFDEVVTGFRYAPGGAQEYYGVTPDMTTLAKILAGGLNGGAVAGKSELFDRFLQSSDQDWVRHQRIPHPGTYNANPLSAAAGIACLEIRKDPAVQKKANATGDALRAGFNEAYARHGVAGKAGGPVSVVSVSFTEPKIAGRKVMHRFKAAMQLGGVDPSGMSLIISAVHGQAEIDQTVEAFDQALALLKEEGSI